MINVCAIVGRLAKDPELKQTQSGVAYTVITVAVERPYAGEGKEKQTDFIDCRAWRGTAEFIAKWFKKGSWIGLDGSINVDNYEAQDGTKRRFYYLNVRQASFVGSNKEAGSEKPASDAPEGFTKIKDEDIPF